MTVSKNVDVSVYQKVKQGNSECGDSYFYHQDDDYFVCALADGLGSGELARESSRAVVDVIESNPLMSITEIIKRSNEALFGKRGVVLGVLKIDLKNQRFTYASIGNIDLMTVSSTGVKKRSIPMTGYLGSYSRIPKIVSGDVEQNMIFFMFSDGVSPTDLTHQLFKITDVKQITNAFTEQMDQNRDDDTTLIAIKYK